VLLSLNGSEGYVRASQAWPLECLSVFDISPRRLVQTICCVEGTGGRMGQTLATNSPHVATELPDSQIPSPGQDGGESVRSATHAELRSHDLDVQLSSRPPTSSGAGTDRPSTLDEFRALVPLWLSDLAHNQVGAVGEFARALQPSLALGPALGRFRALLSQSWGADTAYPGAVSPSDWFVGNPRGQCGVTSFWLSEMLRLEYSIHSTFCRGSVTFVNQQAENLPDHCWLEIDGCSDGDLILDLTCDQADGFDRQIVFDSKARLDIEHVCYESHSRIDISDLPHDRFFWPRYQRLRINMQARVLFGCGAWLALITILEKVLANRNERPAPS
jgi:hypothetical protein